MPELVDKNLQTTTANGVAVPLSDVARLALPEFAAWIKDAISRGSRLCALFGAQTGETERLSVYAVVGDPTTAALGVAVTEVGDVYPSLTPEIPQAHWFERELAEQWGVIPRGHPWLKPIRFHHSYRAGKDAWGRAVGDAILPCVQPEGSDYFKVRGEEIHEVAVGPVHAGVIEPGHFRFQCHGEHVFTLEIELGYQHRGIERRLVGGPDKRTIHYMEALAGDTSIGHATAYCQALEGLASVEVPLRARQLRGIALELERLANHTGDMGALAGDVGYLPTLSFCGRLRGDFLNSTTMICGSRFGRGLVRLGGVGFNVNVDRAGKMSERVRKALVDVESAVDLLWNSTSVMTRFEQTGCVSREWALDLGLVGPAARACGVAVDARSDFPAGKSGSLQVPIATGNSGDVLARADIRMQEIRHSGDFVLEQLNSLDAGPIRSDAGSLQPNARTGEGYLVLFRRIRAIPVAVLALATP